MNRQIFSQLGQRVTKSGVLKEAEKLCESFNKTLYETFQDLGNCAMAYMAGEFQETDWMGRIRDYRNIFNEEPGELFLLNLLVEEVEAIRSKKGFMYSSSLLTPREHRECGSSGYAGFAGPNSEYDDMPVPLANAKLQLEKDKGTVTVEAVRKARELAGMSTIDDKGYVTEKTVKRDSYDFLLPESVSEVKNRERSIKAAVDLLSSHVMEAQGSYSKRFLQPLRRYLKNVGEGPKRLSTPDLINLLPHIRDARTGEYIDFSRVIAGAKAITFGLGYRDTILTPQEILIAGRKINHQGFTNPHMPMGLQGDRLDMRTASRRRAEEQWFMIYTDVFSGYDCYHAISLEPLANDGSTVREPQLTDPNTGQPLKEIMDFYKDKCKEIPFARPGDWFYKG